MQVFPQQQNWEKRDAAMVSLEASLGTADVTKGVLSESNLFYLVFVYMQVLHQRWSDEGLLIDGLDEIECYTFFLPLERTMKEKV